MGRSHGHSSGTARGKPRTRTGRTRPDALPVRHASLEDDAPDGGIPVPGDGLEEGEIRDWCLRAARERVGDTTPEQLPGLWEEFPEAVRGDPELLDLYARALRSAETRNGDLEKHVCAKAEQEFDPSWTAVCARLPGPVSRDLLPRARRWLSRNPGLPQLVLLCARLHMRAGEWDQARTLFEELPPHPQDASVHRDLVRTLLMLGEDRAAVHSMRSASPSAGDAA